MFTAIALVVCAASLTAALKVEATRFAQNPRRGFLEPSPAASFTRGRM